MIDFVGEFENSRWSTLWNKQNFEGGPAGSPWPLDTLRFTTKSAFFLLLKGGGEAPHSNGQVV